MKASIELRMRTYCPGCGVVFMISQVTGARDTYDELCDLVDRSLSQLESATCPKCFAGLKPIGFFEEAS